MYLKKLEIPDLKLIIALIIIALITPWWAVNGEDESVKISTKILIIPANIVTLTSFEQIQDGEISAVSEEVTLVLNLIAVFLIILCLMIGLTIFMKDKFIKFPVFFKFNYFFIYNQFNSNLFVFNVANNTNKRW